jgi:membrane-associated phospholipid phosphatase
MNGALRMRCTLLAMFVPLALLGVPCVSQAQSDLLASTVYPEFRWQVETPLVASGVALLAVGSSLSVTHKIVPAAGLDPADIRLTIDRRVVGENSTRADKDSDYFAVAAVAYPMALSLVTQPSGMRVHGTLRRSVLYAESILLAGGVALLLKNGAEWPRPYTYLPADQRPNNPAYDVTADDAFRSMPSGHATTVFVGAAFAMTDYLISFPEASWRNRASVAFLGGFLAGITSGLRIEGGMHFPTDTMVGGLIGTASGVAVPLVHRYISPDDRQAARPPARAWWQAIGGEAVGIAAGYLAAETY